MSPATATPPTLSGNILGQGDGPAAVAGNNNFASESGNENGINEGSFRGLRQQQPQRSPTPTTPTAATVSRRTDGNGNYAYVYGPDNSTASAGGENTTTWPATTTLPTSTDPYGNVGRGGLRRQLAARAPGGSSDIAEVLYAHGDASATGGTQPLRHHHAVRYLGHPGGRDCGRGICRRTPITTTVSSEITSLNSLFETRRTARG